MLNNALQNYYTLFEDLHVAAAILDSSNLTIDLVNQSMLELWHRPPSINGTPLLEVLPELVDQEYPMLLNKVLTTGKVHKEYGARVLLNRRKKNESVFMDYSYIPIHSSDGTRSTAVLVIATDVCEREMNKLNTVQYKRDLRALVMSAPVAMCIYRDAEFKLEAVNKCMLDLWQGSNKMDIAALQHVFHNGISYSCKQDDIMYTYTPLRNGTQVVNAVCVIAVRS
ncbi:MAG: PAS domain-containing protein [Pedobacter sp.]|uniref:PAS domain-containing protein n=1 Tax=Pedobacter sp. TaxID=1411316 RepID=UPI0033949278